MELARSKKSYSPEFREEALKLVIDTSRPIAQVAKSSALSRGRSVTGMPSARARGEEPPLAISERAELAELRQRARELEQENLLLN
jgi:transposase-like protein